MHLCNQKDTLAHFYTIQGFHNIRLRIIALMTAINIFIRNLHIYLLIY